MTLPNMPTKGKLIAKIEWFSLYLYDGWHFWLQMDGGEGMPIRKDVVMGFLAKQWEKF